MDKDLTISETARTLAELADGLNLPPRFASMGSTEQLKALLNHPQPETVIRRMRPDEFYYLMTGIGLEDSIDLLPMATKTQRQTVQYMEVWGADGFRADRFDKMLTAALDVSLDFAGSLLTETDQEIVALAIFGRARVETMASAEDEVADPSTVLPTPDGTFVLIAQDPDDIPALHQLLNVLYSLGVEEAHNLIQAGRRDTPIALEEEGRRFRSSRLADLGFPEPDQRFAVYESFDVAALRRRLATKVSGKSRGSGQGNPLALALGTGQPTLFIWQVFAIAPANLNQSAIVSDILHLSNRVLATRTEDYSQHELWTDAATHAVRIASIGLEVLSDGNPEAAVEIVGNSKPIEWFRTGFEAIRPAHVIARRVIGDVGGMGRLGLFVSDMATKLAALAAFPPAISFKGVSRDFETMTDVRDAMATVRYARAVLAFARDVLGFDSTKDDKRGPTTFGAVFATAWAKQVLTGELSLAPLNADEIVALRTAAFDGNRIRKGLRLPASDTNDDAADVRRFMNQALDDVEEALSGLNPGDTPDPRFLGDALWLKT